MPVLDSAYRALRYFGILLQEMPLGCNAAAARIRVDRYRQPLLFTEQIADFGRSLGRLGWMVGKRLPRSITWRTSLANRWKSRHALSGTRTCTSKLPLHRQTRAARSVISLVGR